MKVFVSWSGDQSRKTAEKLAEWIRSMFQQNTEVFVSSKDIEKGDRWAERLNEILRDYNFGIAVVDRSNKDKPWINFEAGALSKSVSKSRLVPFLCDVSGGDLLESPLGQFQWVFATSDGMRGLAEALNAGLDRPLDKPALDELFDVWWNRRGKPVCDFDAVPASRGSSQINPTARDIIAQIDRLESQTSNRLDQIAAELASIAADLVQSAPGGRQIRRESQIEQQTRRSAEARMKGYEGEPCRHCGNFTIVRNGDLRRCHTCGGEFPAQIIS